MTDKKEELQIKSPEYYKNKFKQFDAIINQDLQKNTRNVNMLQIIVDLEKKIKNYADKMKAEKYDYTVPEPINEKIVEKMQIYENNDAFNIKELKNKELDGEMYFKLFENLNKSYTLIDSLVQLKEQKLNEKTQEATDRIKKKIVFFQKLKEQLLELKQTIQNDRKEVIQVMDDELTYVNKKD